MINISNYKLSNILIELACKATGTKFINLPVIFNESDDICDFRDGKIIVGNPDNWGITNFRIVSTYFDHFSDICGCRLFGDELNRSYTMSFLTYFFYNIIHNETILDEARSDEPVSARLYQSPLIWVIMKDIICPSYQVKLTNVPIHIVHSHICDISFFVDDEVSVVNDESFIFVNGDIECNPIRDAFLLLSAIHAHGLDSLEIVHEILNSVLKDKIESVLKLAYNEDEEVNGFMMILSAVVGDIDNIDMLMGSYKNAIGDTKMIKTSQVGGGTSTPFWFFGLLENMLEPARGSDWSVYKELMPWFNKIKNKIEQAAKKRGREGLTYEALLRIKDGENTKKDVKVIEKKLVTDRVW